MDTVCGTPLNMAPEILTNQHYTYKADIWSLGVFLYQLLTGQYPFMGANMKELQLKVQEGHYKL
jgi:serine/threonine protein kinase